MSRHAPFCLIAYPSCPCLTCARDHYTPDEDEISPCCTWKKHRRKCQDTASCPHYRKEKTRSGDRAKEKYPNQVYQTKGEKANDM